MRPLPNRAPAPRRRPNRLHPAASLMTPGPSSMRLRLLPLLVLAALCVATAARAASPIQIVVEEEARPDINQDLFFRSQSLFWDEEERPLELVLFREGTEDVLLPILNPDELTAGEVRRMIARAAEQWNDLPGNGFKFDESIRYSDLLAVFENPPLFAGLDQWNLITFQNLTVEYSQIDDSGFATAVLFYVSRDVDLEDVIDPSVLPFFMEENSASEDTVFLDLDGDDVADLRFERREYPAGEIIDGDIVFNESIAFRGFPEDQDDLDDGITIADILGEPDIQALATRELGHLMGGDSSLIPTSIMYSEYAASIDPSDGSEIDTSDGRFLMNPYVGRDLSQQLDARVLGATLYPDGGGGGGIAGTVYRGSVVDNTGDDDLKEVLELVPVFVGRPISFTSASLPADIGSNRGPIRLEANVLTGVGGDGVQQYNSRFTNVTQTFNGDYLFRGLPSAADYGVRLTNDEGFGAEQGAPTIYSSAYEFFSDIADVTDDWYGGAALSPIYTEDNPSNETRADLAVSNPYLSMALFGLGGIRTAYTNAEVINNTNEATFQVVSSEGIIEGAQALRTAAELETTLIVEDDDTDTLSYTYTTANGLLRVAQTATLIDYENVGRADDVRLRYTVTNLAAQSITLNSRVVIEPTISFADGTDLTVVVNPPAINGAWRWVAGAVSPIPATFESQDNKSAPRVRALFRLDGEGVDRPTRVDVISVSQLAREDHPFDFVPDPLILAELSDPDGAIFPSSFEEVPAVALYYDGRVLAPGATTTITLVYGALQYDRIPDSATALDTADPGIVDDDPFVSEPVAVGGGIVGGIDIITNDGDEQPFTFPGGDDGGGDDGGGGDDDDDGLDPTEEEPVFEDESPASGGIALPDDNLFIFGGALGDVDNDGDLDLFVAVSARAEDDFEGAGLANRLYINRIYDRDVAGNVVYTGTRRFDDVTFGTDGVPGTSDDRIPFQQDASFSALLADWDGDGDQDVFVCNFAGPGGSSGFDQLIGRQNRLLINQGGRQGGTLGFFADGTGTFLPGMHNSGANLPYPAATAMVVFPGLSDIFSGAGGGVQEPASTWSGGFLFDVTTSAVTADMNNDGLLDLVVGNANTWHDAEGTAGILAGNLFNWRDPAADPPIPIPGGDPNVDLVGLFASERILINLGYGPGGAWLGFRDETLGTDDVFGGGDVFTVTYPDQTSTPFGTPRLDGTTFLAFNTWDDRLPPVYPNFRTDDDGTQPVPTGELDGSNTYALALGSFTTLGSSAPDIFVGNRREPSSLAGNGFRIKSQKRSGNNMVMMNLDRTGDDIADGYFLYWNANTGDVVPFVGLTADSLDWLVETPNNVWTVRNVSTTPAGITYQATPLMPIFRFDGDPGDLENTDFPEVDLVPFAADHTVASFVGDFDYRGSWQVFNVNLLTGDGGDLNPGGTGVAGTGGNLNSTFYRLARGHGRGANDLFNGGFTGLGYGFGEPNSAIGTTVDNLLPGRDAQNIIGGAYFSPSAVTFPIAGFTMAGTTDFPQLPVGVGRPQGASVADFNLDGDLDIIISGDTSQAVGADIFFIGDNPGQLQFFDNNSFARFNELTTTVFGQTAAARYMSMLTGDLDNDGDKDFIVFTLGEGTRVFYNGVLSAGPDSSTENDFFTFVDSTNDYLHPVYSTDVNPGQLFAPGQRINATTAVDFADLNGDGFYDFVAGRGGFNTVRGDTNDLYFGTNPAAFNVAQRHFRLGYASHPVGGTLPPETFVIADPTTDIALADLDGDLVDDMIVLNRGTFSEVYLNRDGDPDAFEVFPLDPNGAKPDGYFVRQVASSLPFPNATTRQSATMAIGNFDPLLDGGAGSCGAADGIGRLDVVVGNGPNIRNVLFLNNGDGSFRDASAGLPRVVNPNTGDDMDDTRDIVTSDFNGDGFLDLFVLNRFETRLINGVSTITKERSRLFFGDGAGNFTDVTAGDDGVLGTSDDRLPLIIGEVTSALVADFDLAGSPTEDLDGDGRLRSHEPEFYGRHVASSASAGGVEIPDTSEIAVDLVLGQAGCVGDLDISVNLTHPSMNNVRLRLQSPSGTFVTLFDGLGGSGANMNTTVFDDAADTAITAGSPPYGGRFRPQQPLSAFNGQPIAGTWRLFVRDNQIGATGTLNTVSISVETPRGTIDRAEPFQASYDIFITRAGEASDLLLVNDGTGRFTASGGLPSVQRSSYHAAAGNIYLRSISQEIGGQVIQRPLIDIVAGIDQDIATGGAALLYLNSATSPGTFSNASHEIPRVRSTVLNTVEADDVTGNIRAVHLADVDRDGDLDLYLGQNGRFTTQFVGATDWLLTNRVIGEGYLNLTRDPNPLQPGIVPGLRVASVDPGGAARGETRVVRVYGSNFRNGIRFDFGEDIEVLGYGGLTSGWVDVKIRVAPTAELGSRTIVVRDELGLPYRSDSRIFKVLLVPAGQTAAAGWELFE